jgi:Icc-related predicted phosphoesterase
MEILNSAFNNLNNYEFQNHFIDFTKNPYEIKNSDGQVVFRPGPCDNPIDDLIETDYGLPIVLEANRILLEEIRGKYSQFNFSTDLSLAHNRDYEISIEHSNEQQDILKAESSFLKLINFYNDYRFDNLIVTGSVSKFYLDKIKNSIGEQNVKVLNITRNPSVTYFVGAEYNSDNIAFNDLRFFTNEMLYSVLNNITLKNLDGVTSVKFEDILINRKFSFLGKEIDCPSQHINCNGFLTEHDNLNLSAVQLQAQDIDSFNSIFTNLQQYVLDKLGFTSNLPSNVFSDLEYTPLSYSQITASNT